VLQVTSKTNCKILQKADLTCGEGKFNLDADLSNFKNPKNIVYRITFFMSFGELEVMFKRTGTNYKIYSDE
jgi:hypothetical protein